MLKKLETLGSKLNRSQQQHINGGGSCSNGFCGSGCQCCYPSDCIPRFPHEPPELWSCINGFCQQF